MTGKIRTTDRKEASTRPHRVANEASEGLIVRVRINSKNNCLNTKAFGYCIGHAQSALLLVVQRRP